jgi:hypothetical protein
VRSAKSIASAIVVGGREDLFRHGFVRLTTAHQPRRPEARMMPPRSTAVGCMRWLDRYLIRLDSLMVKPSEPLALTNSSNSFAMFVLRVVWN